MKKFVKYPSSYVKSSSVISSSINLDQFLKYSDKDPVSGADFEEYVVYLPTSRGKYPITFDIDNEDGDVSVTMIADRNLDENLIAREIGIGREHGRGPYTYADSFDDARNKLERFMQSVLDIDQDDADSYLK